MPPRLKRAPRRHDIMRHAPLGQNRPPNTDGNTFAKSIASKGLRRDTFNVAALITYSTPVVLVYTLLLVLDLRSCPVCLWDECAVHVQTKQAWLKPGHQCRMLHPLVVGKIAILHYCAGMHSCIELPELLDLSITRWAPPPWIPWVMPWS